jgi:hypothetical protein
VIPAKKYASGIALRTALEERLKRASREEAIDLQRLRRQVPSTGSSPGFFEGRTQTGF